MAKVGAIVPQASGDRPLPPAHSPEILREAKLAVAYAVEGKKKRVKFGDLFEAQNGEVFIRDGSSAVVKILRKRDAQFWGAEVGVYLREIQARYLGEGDCMAMVGAIILAVSGQESVDNKIMVWQW